MPKSFKHGQSESCCFPSAGLRCRHHITTMDHRWNRLFLNRRWVDIPLVPQRFEKGFTESQVFEADLGIDRDRGLADRVGAESFTLGGGQNPLFDSCKGLSRTHSGDLPDGILRNLWSSMWIGGLLLRHTPSGNPGIAVVAMLDQNTLLFICGGIKAALPMGLLIQTTTKPDPTALTLHRCHADQ